MNQCRICFGNENEYLMICPCNCRGSSAYIHIECLEEYFEHYPDRICRVCHQHMYYSTPFDKLMFTLLMIWLSILILVSNTNMFVKSFFLSLLLSVVFVKYLRSIVNLYVSIFIIACTLLVSTTSYIHLTSSILFVGILVTVITLGMYIPLRFILLFFVNILIACYCIVIVVFFAEKNDAFITSCLVSIFLFGWAFIIQYRPPARYL